MDAMSKMCSVDGDFFNTWTMDIRRIHLKLDKFDGYNTKDISN